MTTITHDLHNHSQRSKDGHTPVRALVDLAMARGLRGLGVCDHDVLPDSDPAIPAFARERGLLLLQGVEFSCRKTHIIGYWGRGIQAEEADLAYMRRRFDQLARNLEQVTRLMLAMLAERGIHVEYDVLEAKAGKQPQKVFLFKYLSDDLGLFPNWGEARRYMREEGIYLPDNHGLEDLHPATAVELIHRSGGLAIWAHPFLTPEPLRRELVPDMLDAGLACLETAYAYRENGYHGSESNTELRTRALELASRHGLLQSGGSDSHYPVKTGANGAPIRPGDEGLDQETARPLLERLGVDTPNQ